ncbi:MAG: hypothetical protein RR374_01865 [Clostridia bacterium]
MKNKKRIVLGLVNIILILAMMMAFVACKPEVIIEVEDTFTLSVIDGANTVKVDKSTLKDIKLVDVTTNTTNSTGTAKTREWKAISFKQLLETLKITTAVTSVKAVATDKYEVTYKGEQFENLYIGLLYKDGEKYVALKSASMFDKTATSANETAKDVATITINPVVVPPTPPTPPATKDPEVPAFSLTVDALDINGVSAIKNGAKTINKDSFKDVALKEFSQTVKGVKTSYKGFSIADILTAIGAKDTYATVKFSDATESAKGIATCNSGEEVFVALMEKAEGATAYALLDATYVTRLICPSDTAKTRAIKGVAKVTFNNGLNIIDGATKTSFTKEEIALLTKYDLAVIQKKKGSTTGETTTTNFKAVKLLDVLTSKSLVINKTNLTLTSADGYEKAGVTADIANTYILIEEGATQIFRIAFISDITAVQSTGNWVKSIAQIKFN